MSKKLISIIIIAVAILGFGLYWFLFREKKPEFVFQKITKGTVVQDVSETGSVKVSEKTALGFKHSGKIKKIYVKVGDNVGPGQVLAEVDTAQLEIELKADKADLEVVKAKKADAEISLQNAKQSLKDAQATAEEKLKSAYEDAANVLDDYYLKIYNSFNVASDIQRDYFGSNDQQGRRVSESKNKIGDAMDSAKSSVAAAKKDPQNKKIDEALAEVRTALKDTRDALEVIRNMTEAITYRDTVSSTDKTSLDNQKSYIITALNNLVNAQQTISSAKISNETSINNAKAKISSLENQLQEGGLYDAQINQVQAKIKLLENKIAEAVLRAPGRGQVVDINKREGEVVQPTDAVISFLPAGPFQIEVDIYEEDIVKVKIGEPVDIALTAFPGQTLKGKVFSIDPAEKLIEGVVYYKVTINFLELKKGIKPGMTADITIKTAERNNVLLIPKEAVEDIDGQRTVQVRKNGEIEARKIETGLEGEDFFEVVSGLKKGEEVVIGKKI